MEDNFTKRGCSKQLIEEKIEIANTKSRSETLTYKTKKSNNRIPLVATFNPTLPHIGSILTLGHTAHKTRHKRMFSISTHNIIQK